MKIGFFTDGYLPQINGVAISVDAFKESLTELKHKVYIVAPQYPKYKDKDKNVLRLKSIKIYNNPEIRFSYMFPDRILRQVITEDFDIIHGFSGGSIPSLGLALSKIKRKPYVFTYNTRWNQYTHYILNGKVVTKNVVEKATAIYCNRCDTIIAPAQFVKDELLSFGVKKPITVIPNGVNTKRFKPENKDYLKKQLGLSENSKIVLYVGRLAKEKSLDFLIKAFARLPYSKNYYLVLVGDGPEKENLMSLAKKEGLADKVIFAGSVPHSETKRFLNSCDIFLSLYNLSNLGNPVLEAMSCGKCVVALNSGEMEDVIENGQDGVLIRFEDLENAGPVVLELLKNDKKRAALGRSALAKSRVKFWSWDKRMNAEIGEVTSLVKHNG